MKRHFTLHLYIIVNRNILFQKGPFEYLLSNKDIIKERVPHAYHKLERIIEHFKCNRDQLVAVYLIMMIVHRMFLY